MAIPGFGFRTVNTLLMEISLHLVEPIVQTTLTESVAAPGVASPTVGSTANIYVDALLVCDTGTNAEVISVLAIGAGSIEAVFAKAHASGVPLTAATFPTQEGTDPIFTQAEMIGYVSRAQNEFLEQVPVAFAQFFQQTTTGQLYQPLPATAIELDHVALSQLSLPITSLVRSGSVVTATFADPHDLSVGDTFWVVQPEDLTFQGVFEVASIIGPPSMSNQLTYLQYLADASTTGGTVAYFSRLYEVTQSELTMANRQWRQGWGTPQNFFQDRTGNYQWGLGAIPAVGAPLELICSVRDADTLTLLDGFIIPDTILHFVKYLAMSYAFSKDGVYHDAQRAKYCEERFKRGVATVQRFLDSMIVDAQGVG